MKVHHLNCGTMCPLLGRYVEGEGSVFSRGNRLCHCLLVETNAGLVLVETGIGMQDVLEPARRFGWLFRAATLPRFDPEETAIAQVARLGFAPEDVRHVLLTHGHGDHAGGVADFPWATVHLTRDEHDAMTAPRNARERRVYRRSQWEHGARWAPHVIAGETWNGFAAIRPLPDVAPDILFLPLPGHTRGHTAVVVPTGDRVLVHAGDLYLHRDQLGERAEPPPALRVFHCLVDSDGATRRQNLARLKALVTMPGVTVFCAHDPVEFERTRAGSALAAVRDATQAATP